MNYFVKMDFDFLLYHEVMVRCYPLVNGHGNEYRESFQMSRVDGLDVHWEDIDELKTSIKRQRLIHKH